MISTVHTLPDYTTKYRMVQVFGSTDVNENAVRLGSIDTFDRRGNVIVLDDFEGVFLKWDMVRSAAPNDAVLIANRAKNGSQSCKLEAGAVANEWVGIENYFIIPQLGKIGFEISFTKAAFVKYIEWFYTLYTGVYKYETGIRYTVAGGLLEYYNDAAGWTELHPGIKLHGGTHTFHTLKVVVDAGTGRYVRALLNNNYFDMSAINMDSTGDVTAAKSYFSVKSTAQGVFNGNMYVDDFILTQNEP